MRIGREIAQLAQCVGAPLLLILSSLGLHLTEGQQGALNAAIVAVAGFITAAGLSQEKAAAAVAGVAQALIAVALAFGWQLAPDVQGAVMTLVTVGVGLWLRTQVVAKVGPETPRPVT
ncbi:hypothetical protein [Actinomycetospora aeridis]|uniref:Holin n=1 Tax=Actinomycetospora aeridis TaxID=3129231 RepID=A0ABU8N178_9PSEU